MLRKHELDTKTEWLGADVLQQADRMVDVLQLNHTSKEKAMMAVGGPAHAGKVMRGFGGTISQPRPQTQQAARRPAAAAAAAAAAANAARPGTAAAGTAASPGGPATPTGPASQVSAAQGAAHPLQGTWGLRRRSCPGRSTAHGAAQVPLYGAAARRHKQAVAAAAKASKAAEERLKANHWRRCAPSSSVSGIQTIPKAARTRTRHGVRRPSPQRHAAHDAAVASTAR